MGDTVSAQGILDAAVLLLAVDHVLWDDDSPKAAYARAQGIFLARDNDPLWRDGQHHGDCTKEAHTCVRCLADEYIEEARQRVIDEDGVPTR